MNHTFTLSQPTREVSPIRLIVSHKGKVIRRSTGLSIRTELWRGAARKISAKCGDARVWERLAPIHLRLTERELTAPTDAEVLAAIAYALTGEERPIEPDHPSLWDYFEDWSKRGPESAKDRGLAFRRITALMGRTTDWEDIDGDWYFRFLDKCNALNYTPNYISTMTAKLKTVMNEGFNRGFHTNEAFRKFSTAYRPADTIALTQEEMDALWSAPLEGRVAQARDVFMVGCLTAARFQDYSQLSGDNIVDGRLRYVQRKTGQVVVLPLSPRIAEIFSRYGGRLPKITQQEVGRLIKTACRSIGGSFDDVMEVSHTRGGRKEIERIPRWRMVSTHTARRSAITALHLLGVPTFQLMMLSGHTTIENFQRYLRLDRERNADLLATNPFFR